MARSLLSIFKHFRLDLLNRFFFHIFLTTHALGQLVTQDDNTQNAHLIFSDPYSHNLPQHGSSLLHTASLNNQVDLLHTLLAIGITIEGDERTHPLIVAAEHGHIDIIHQMLTECDITERLPSGYRLIDVALARALQYQRRLVVELLISKGANINGTEQQNQQTLLFQAVLQGKTDAAEQLLFHQASPNITTVSGLTPLTQALINEDEEMAQLLINHGAQINSHINIQAITAIIRNHEINEDQLERIIQLFHNLGGDTLLYSGRASVYEAAILSRRDSLANTIMQIEPRLNTHFGVIPLLNDPSYHRANLSSITYEDPSISATPRSHIRLGEVILAFHRWDNTNFSYLDRRLRIIYPLMIAAAAEGNNNIISSLIESIVASEELSTLFLREHILESALQQAVSHDRVTTAELLLKKGANANTYETRHGRSLLFQAVLNEHTNMARLLLANGASTEAFTNEGITSMAQALRNNHSDMIHLLIEYGANIQTYRVIALIENMIRDNHPVDQVISAFITHGGDITANRRQGFPSLFSIAITSGRIELAETMAAHWQATCDIDRTSANSGHTLLLTAIRRGHAHLVQHLLLRGASLRTMSRRGHTPLSLALLMGNEFVIQVLTGNGASIQDINTLQGVIRTVRANRSQNRRSDALRHFINLGGDITAQDENNNSIITAIAGQETLGNEMISYIQERYGHIDTPRATNGDTLLMIAIRLQNYSLTESLLNQNASLTETNHAGQTPIEISFSLADQDIINLLKERWQHHLSINYCQNSVDSF